jgi:LmbE family N-acetylglucosaminyl deacetylase
MPGRLRNALWWLWGPGGSDLEGRVVAVSVHLDDAVFSVGAGLARAARRGADVTVLTVLAGDPVSETPAGEWDHRSGFATAGEAARVRRDEDRRACALLGVRPVWLPYSDHQYERGGSDEEIAGALIQALEGAEVVLLPGFPLDHPDHRWLGEVLAGASVPGEVVRFLEQPYTALWSSAPAEQYRLRLAASARDRLAKIRALRSYRSQLELLDERVVFRTTRYEAARGGEAVSRGEAAASAP